MFEGTRYAYIGGQYVVNDAGTFKYNPETEAYVDIVGGTLEEVKAGTADYVNNYSGNIYASPYQTVYDVQSGELKLDVVSLSVVGELNLSSQGLRQGSGDYANSFSAWVGTFLAELLGKGDVLGGVLSGMSGDNIILNLPSQTINVVLEIKARIPRRC